MVAIKWLPRIHVPWMALVVHSLSLVCLLTQIGWGISCCHFWLLVQVSLLVLSHRFLHWSLHTPGQCPVLELQLFPMNKEFPVGASHKLALITSLPFVHLLQALVEFVLSGVWSLVGWRVDLLPAICNYRKRHQQILRLTGRQWPWSRMSGASTVISQPVLPVPLCVLHISHCSLSTLELSSSKSALDTDWSQTV